MDQLAGDLEAPSPETGDKKAKKIRARECYLHLTSSEIQTKLTLVFLPTFAFSFSWNDPHESLRSSMAPRELHVFSPNHHPANFHVRELRLGLRGP